MESQVDTQSLQDGSSSADGRRMDVPVVEVLELEKPVMWVGG